MSTTRESVKDQRAYSEGLRRVARGLWHWRRRYPESNTDGVVSGVEARMFQEARKVEEGLK